MLLERGGETVYFGEIGEDSKTIRDYFARHGAHCPANVNPAEYMLEAIGAGVAPRIGNKDWKDIWLESPEFKQVLAEIEQIKAEGLSRPEPAKADTRTCKPLLTPGAECVIDLASRCHLVLRSIARGCQEEHLALVEDSQLYLH